MEELAHSLLGTLKRSSAPVETKLSLLNSLKSSIKHQRIPDGAHSPTIECIRIAITTQTSSTLVTAGFSTLTHLIKRLTIQEDTDALFSQRANLLPLLLDKLGDVKEAHRQAASQLLCDLWPLKSNEVEKIIREGAIQGTHVRAKEAGMEWVTKMHTQQALQFRNFVGPIVECLEDAEGSVRDCAKANILELFKDARDAAKADLKRQLIAYNVRRSITSYILSELQIPGYAESTVTATTHSSSRHDILTHDQGAGPAMSTKEEQNSSPSESTVDPMFVQSSRELEDIFRTMPACFEGREGDDNWKPRDLNVTKLRRLLQGNALNDHHQMFVAGIKALLDGILKVANSLRTTMATNGCLLIQEMAKTLGTAMDPMIDMILQGLEKMSASTKNINGLNAFATIDIILAHATFHVRLVQHIWQAAQDKNIQPRTFASGWLKTILKTQAHHKAHFEHSGALELADKAIRKCLTDQNPKTRENMRSTFWMFAQMWPERGEAIMATLDVKSRQLLEKDSANPNQAQPAVSFTASVGPTSAANPRAAPSTTRTSLKDTIAAQKKAALAAKRVPERPSSAMSSFSPVRQATTAAARAAPTPAPPQTRPVTSTDTQPPPPRPALGSFNTSTGSGLLSSAPMRRPRRPDLPRPATADIYPSNRIARAGTPTRSPVVSPSRLSAQSSLNEIATGSAAGPIRAGNVGAGSVTSPRINPGRGFQTTPQLNLPMSNTAAKQPTNVTRNVPLSPSPSPNEENFTIFIPQGVVAPRQLLSPRARNEPGRPQPRHSLPTMNEEDNFTLVMPRMTRPNGLGSPNTSQAHMLPVAEAQSSDVESRQLRSPNMPMAPTNIFNPAPPMSSLGSANLKQMPNLQDEALIIFEDPTVEDLVIPLNSIENCQAVLEELHLNPQSVQMQIDDFLPLEPVDMDYQTERPISPSKKVARDIDTLGDRATTQRMFRSSIEQLRDGGLDTQGFATLLTSIKHSSNGPSQSPDELMPALLAYFSTSTLNTASDKLSTQSHKSQALACIRALTDLPSEHEGSGKLYTEALRVLILESQYHNPSSTFMQELHKTEDALISHLGDPSTCLDSLAAHDWQQHSTHPEAHSRVIPRALRILAALATTLSLSPFKNGPGTSLSPSPGLTASQRTRLTALAFHCLSDMNADVRRAATEFCVALHGAFGAEGEKELWAMLREGRAGEGRVKLVAYYLARSKNGGDGGGETHDGLGAPAVAVVGEMVV